MPSRPITALLALACAAATAACGDTSGASLPCVSTTPSLSPGGGLPTALPTLPGGIPSGLPGGGSSAPAGGASGAVDCIRSEVPSQVPSVSGLPSLPTVPPTVAPPAVPSGRFRLSVVGFRAVHETVDHAFEVDGKRDEVMIRAKLRSYDLTSAGGAYGERDSLVLGDTNQQSNRMQAGSASGQGGIRTGDTVDHCVSGEPRCQLPFVLWEGELRAGRDAMAVVPLLSEIDATRDTELTEPDWPARLGGLAPGLLTGAANSVRSRLGLPALGTPLPGPLDPGARVAIGELLDTASRDDFKVTRRTPGGTGRAGDRPIGFVNAAGNANRQDYFPRIVMLTYETATLAARTDLGSRGPGSLTVRFAESQHWLEGDYELFLQIEAI